MHFPFDTSFAVCFGNSFVPLERIYPLLINVCHFVMVTQPSLYNCLLPYPVPDLKKLLLTFPRVCLIMQYKQ